MADEHDFVVIGGGTAGCVLANRLSADPKTSVALLEAGGEARHPFIHIPLMAGLVYFMRSINWSYETEPEPHLDGRRIPWPRGKVLGGTSAINGMMYMRGSRLDYDGWRQLGLDGWDYESVLPYFKRAEGHGFAPRRLPWHRRPAPSQSRPVEEPALRRLPRGLRNARPAAQRRFQRRGAGRRGPAGLLRRPGAPREHRPCVHPAGA